MTDHSKVDDGYRTPLQRRRRNSIIGAVLLGSALALNSCPPILVKEEPSQVEDSLEEKGSDRGDAEEGIERKGGPQNQGDGQQENLMEGLSPKPGDESKGPGNLSEQNDQNADGDRRPHFQQKNPQDPSTQDRDKNPQPDARLHSSESTTGTGIPSYLALLNVNYHILRAQQLIVDSKTKEGLPQDRLEEAPQSSLQTIIKGSLGPQRFNDPTNYFIKKTLKEEDPKRRDAAIFLDLSSSTEKNVIVPYRRPNPLPGPFFQPPPEKPKPRQPTKRNIAAIAGIAIAQYYIQELGTSVRGVAFNAELYYTPFTQDIEQIATLFARVPSGGTVLNAEILQTTLVEPARPNAGKPLDIYFISDLNIANVDQLIQQAETYVNLANVYVIQLEDTLDMAKAKALFGEDTYVNLLRRERDLPTLFDNFVKSLDEVLYNKVVPPNSPK